MSSEHFYVKKHVIPCAHIREYPRAIKTVQEDVLKLAIKQYSPHDSPKPHELALTIIAGHVNGLTKELYEPLWDDLYVFLRRRGIKIRGIWAADSSHQGESGVINEHVQGDDPSWFDHSRDLLSMVNIFRAEMMRPIIGIGSSMSCVQMPKSIFVNNTSKTFHEPYFDRARQDLWETREAAEKSFLQNKMFKSWDPRVVDLFFQHCLKTVPTPLYPHTSKDGSNSPKAVTLTTTKQQEAWTYLRTNFTPQDLTTREGQEHDRLQSPDMDPNAEGALCFQCPAATVMAAYLPFIRPPVLYVFGVKSYLSTPELVAERMSTTGTGRGGSGGEKAGAVKKFLYKNHGHLICFENPRRIASDLAEYLEREVGIFQKTEQF